MNASNDGSHSELDVEQRRHVLESLMESGVEIVDPDRTYVGSDVQVASGVVLYPGTHLRGSTTIQAGCQIGPDCWVEDSAIEEGCIVRYSVLEQARIRERTRVGPYAHLRPGADVGPEARIGNFVEVKNSRLKRGVKAGHLAYIGDSDVGEAANIGAGVITCNYDGKSKHRTIIGKDAFIGSNAALVAPVTIGEGATVAAGTVISRDVPPEALAFGRARQVNRESRRRAEEGGSDAR